jgi:hypothetical protein
MPEALVHPSMPKVSRDLRAGLGPDTQKSSRFAKPSRIEVVSQKHCGVRGKSARKQRAGSDRLTR